jgi:UDP-N-acetylglucosamine 3-dehydrogenase
MGVMGRNHARILSQLAGARLVGVYDSDQRVRETAAASGWIVLDDLEAVVAAHPQLVVLAVPTSAHRSVAEALVSPGVSLLVEKPLAQSIADGQAILAAASRARARISVGHVERFNPVVVALRELLDGDQLGPLFGFGARRLGPFPPRVSDVGVVIDLASHDIDAITYLHPSRVSRVHAELHHPKDSEHEHIATAILRFDDSVIASIEANWVSPAKIRALSVTGERGAFLGNYLSQELTFVRRAVGPASLRMEDVQYLVEHESVEISLPRAEPLRRELEAVLDAVARDHDLPISGEDGLRVLRLAEAVKDAGQRGVVVSPE